MTKFETGKTYSGNFICDADSWFHFEIVRRTDKSAWIRNTQYETETVKRVKINVSDGYEFVYPMGSGYSMAPIITSNSLLVS